MGIELALSALLVEAAPGYADRLVRAIGQRQRVLVATPADIAEAAADQGFGSPAIVCGGPSVADALPPLIDARETLAP